MKVTKQVRNFLTILTMTIAPIFLMFAAFTMYYDGIRPSTAFTAMVFATIMVIIYGFLVSFIGVKKWIKKIG